MPQQCNRSSAIALYKGSTLLTSPNKNLQRACGESISLALGTGPYKAHIKISQKGLWRRYFTGGIVACAYVGKHMASGQQQAAGWKMLCIVLAAVLFVHGGSSGASLPRCQDSVCAQGPLCTRAKLPAVCWNVGDSTAAPCRCCQNCINPGTRAFQRL